MNLRLLTLTLGGMIALAGCVDASKDSGTTAEADTDTDTDADTDTDTDADTFTITGGLVIAEGAAWVDKSATVYGLWNLSGTSTDCGDCLFGFDGDFTLAKGTGDNFSRSVTVSNVYAGKGYDVGLVYADSDMWGYAIDYAADGYTYVYNYYQYASGAATYAYLGYWYR